MQTVNQEPVLLTEVAKFSRPYFKVSPDFFFSEGKYHTFKFIDPYFYNSLTSLKKGFFEDIERRYQHFYTASKKLNYEQIFCFLKNKKNIDDFYLFLKKEDLMLGINEIITTVGYLVQKDIEGKGILRNLYPSDPEHLYLGYFAVDYEVFIAILERKQNVIKKQREYHLHYTLPINYRPGSNLILKY